MSHTNCFTSYRWLEKIKKTMKRLSLLKRLMILTLRVPRVRLVVLYHNYHNRCRVRYTIIQNNNSQITKRMEFINKNKLFKKLLMLDAYWNNRSEGTVRLLRRELNKRMFNGQIWEHHGQIRMSHDQIGKHHGWLTISHDKWRLICWTNEDLPCQIRIPYGHIRIFFARKR